MRVAVWLCASPAAGGRRERRGEAQQEKRGGEGIKDGKGGHSVEGTEPRKKKGVFVKVVMLLGKSGLMADWNATVLGRFNSNIVKL
ncbi:hypothetical protein E2C01_007453 [Portunus trituberculatus]|uniref:Uncharacterized protein n=1 Tax=Portunus trituberculatus TaxID=210409 RepID=A0A5B7CY87_PORTR|nr:hypothetical protein [Portunus trituberculatus]